MFIMKKLICLATLILFGTIIVPSVTVLAEDTSSVSTMELLKEKLFLQMNQLLFLILLLKEYGGY